MQRLRPTPDKLRVVGVYCVISLLGLLTVLVAFLTWWCWEAQAEIDRLKEDVNRLGRRRAIAVEERGTIPADVLQLGHQDADRTVRFRTTFMTPPHVEFSQLDLPPRFDSKESEEVKANKQAHLKRLAAFDLTRDGFRLEHTGGDVPMEGHIIHWRARGVVFPGGDPAE